MNLNRSRMIVLGREESSVCKVIINGSQVDYVEILITWDFFQIN